MEKKHWMLTLLLSAVGIAGISAPVSTQAQSYKGNMGISFKGLVDPGYGILDPENPSEEVQYGGNYGKTTGDLRIDFVADIEFNQHKISFGDTTYDADALQLENVIAPRGQFIQISDYREDQTGWSLQVRQENQFTHQKNDKSQLAGAVLSFDNSWVSTPNGAGSYPNVSKEVIYLSNIGETYTLAHAEKGTGGGTWSIVFGASPDNTQEKNSTINPRLDEEGQPIIDTNKKDQAFYVNKALRLSIPSGAAKEAGTYSTVLTWIISELP